MTVFSFASILIVKKEGHDIVDPNGGLPDGVTVEGMDSERLGARQLDIVALLELGIRV